MQCQVKFEIVGSLIVSMSVTHPVHCEVLAVSMVFTFVEPAGHFFGPGYTEKKHDYLNRMLLDDPNCSF